MKLFHLTLAFILEIIAFISFAAIVLFFPAGKLWHVAWYVSLFIILICFWGIYMSPKALKRFSGANYYIIKSIIYLVSTISLYQYKGKIYAIVFVVLFLLNEYFLHRENK